MTREEITPTTYKHMEVKGKIASVQTSFSSDKLVIIVKEMQRNEKNKNEVTVYQLKRDFESVGLAFGFLYENQQVFPVVVGDEVKLKMKTDVDTACFDENCLFQWQKKTGQWGILKSVAEPQKCLCIDKDKVIVGPLKDGAEFRLTSK